MSGDLATLYSEHFPEQDSPELRSISFSMWPWNCVHFCLKKFWMKHFCITCFFEAQTTSKISCIAISVKWKCRLFLKVGFKPEGSLSSEWKFSLLPGFLDRSDGNVGTFSAGFVSPRKSFRPLESQMRSGQTRTPWWSCRGCAASWSCRKTGISEKAVFKVFPSQWVQSF